jgi:proteasome lid subunit RPN8/RPN11
MVKKLQVECSAEIMESIEEHCFSELQVEVGGFLLGKNKDGVSEISVAVKAEKTKQSQAQLTFTHETWDALHKLIDEKHSDLELIGWYHSHPGFGVFLSDYDAFIQHSFFSSPHNVALVVDPIKGLRGWFVSKNEKVELLKEEKTTKEKISSKDKITAIAEQKTGNSKLTLNFGLVATAIVLLGIIFAAIGFVTSNSLQRKSQEISDLQNQLLFLAQSTPTIQKFSPINGDKDAFAILNFQYQVENEKTLLEVANKVYGPDLGLEQILAVNPTLTKESVLQEGDVVVVPVQATFNLPESAKTENSNPSPATTVLPSASPTATPSPSATQSAESTPGPIPSVKKK